MSRKFTKIPQETFNELQVDAGVLVKNFSVDTPNLEDADIICATTGGINVTCTPTFSDWGEDVDNCPNGMKELMHLDSWETSIGLTALNVTPEIVRRALGAADVTDSDGKIVPRMELKDTDFADVWWIGDRSDDGLVAVRLINALSTAGLSLQTTKNGKGQISITLSGHVSINAQDVVPMEFYVKDGSKDE